MARSAMHLFCRVRMALERVGFKIIFDKDRISGRPGNKYITCS